MSRSSVPVDPFNPGQVFACLGLLEAAEHLIGSAAGGFEWQTAGEPMNRFWVSVKEPVDPVLHVLAFLAAAEVKSLAPAGSTNETEAWKVPTIRLRDDDPFPFPDPSSPATLPAVIESVGKRLIIDHWGESKTGRDAVKFWGGAAGFPGAGLARDALNAVRDRCVAEAGNPFNIAAEQSSSFRFDWRRDYIPIDAGFSLNNHSDMTPIGYPLVELLAALGLSHARPRRHDKLTYSYEILGVTTRGDTPSPQDLYCPPLLRAALGGTSLPFPKRRFRMKLGWPAKEGQARAITIVTEEAPDDSD